MSAVWQLRNTAVYLGFAIATSAIGFGAVMILTRMLSPAEYGVIGIFFSILYFVAPMVSLSADGLIGVSKAKLDLQGYRTFQEAYICLAYTCFVVAQVLFLVAWVADVYKDLLIAGVPLFGLVRFLSGMAAAEYVVEERPVVYGTFTLVTSGLSLILAVALIKLFGAWGGFRIISMCTADALILVVRFRGRLGILLRPHWNSEMATQVLRFGLPALVAVAGAWALNEADKVIVAHELGMEAAGVYAAASALAAIMMTFTQALTNALYPELFRKLAAGNISIGALVTSYTVKFVGLTSAFCAVVIIGYLVIGDILLPQRYLGGRDVFIALMLTALAVSLYRPFGLIADYFHLARIRTLALLTGGFLTVVVADLGVRDGNLLWAPIGIASGYVFATMVLAIGLKSYTRK